jgi:cellulose synthase/poly-beta-1,6-N-acetylglucosamine synthase-like glycosyltransferase
MQERSIVRVGLFAHNEEATVEHALGALLDQRLDDLEPELPVELVDVTLVSCASTDRTDEIVRRIAKSDPRVHLVANAFRRGKAFAVNHFTSQRRADFYVLVSADVVLEKGALAALLRPFRDAGVGMTGARPVPRNARQGVGSLVHLLWELHDRVARGTPQLGAALALRGPCPLLPEWTWADEAMFEADVTLRRALRLVYCPEAAVYNRGPDSFGDYVELRTRIAAAHTEIERAGYRPATRDFGRILRHGAAYLREHPESAYSLLAAALVEAYAWCAGQKRARDRPESGVWQALPSAKREVNRPASDDARAARPARSEPSSPLSLSP